MIAADSSVTFLPPLGANFCWSADQGGASIGQFLHRMVPSSRIVVGFGDTGWLPGRHGDCAIDTAGGWVLRPCRQYGGITIRMLIIMFLRIITVLFPLNFTGGARTNMRPSRSCERLLCLRLRGSWARCSSPGCPAVGRLHPTTRSNEGSRASLGTPSESQHARAANPVTIAAPPASSYASTPVAKEEPAPLPEIWSYQPGWRRR